MIMRLALPKIAPAHVAALTFSAGVGLAVAGVQVLAGTGWALIAGAVPLLLVAGVLIRGLLHVQ
jgi:hypothetical protein